ncbi:MAG: hypothetical protein CME06_02355 [Gemmatimonadetes bacterium]|nr:hypothetical protein [Gemmatimonadota bacterium]
MLALSSCVEPPNGPALAPLVAPSFVSPSTPTASEERGVDAEASAELGIHVEWHRPSEAVTDVSLYRAEGGSAFALLAGLAPSDTAMIDFVPNLGTWSYALEVHDSENRVSASTDTVAVTLIRKADPISPAPQSSSGPSPVFQWSWPEAGTLPRFVVRVEALDNGSNWISPLMEFFEGAETIETEYGPELEPPDLLPGSYRWRVDAVDPSDPYRGSESLWIAFEVSS